jgi:predicted transcriptional regulator of viral defense system
LPIADVIGRYPGEKPDTVRTTVSNLKKKGLLYEVTRGVYGRAAEHRAEGA